MKQFLKNALVCGLIIAGFTLKAQTYPIASGPFKPTWESLQQNYQLPEWYRDAKFGIWAHWGPQCEPAIGDWYANRMYQYNSTQYKYHVSKYGHPSKFGFKDVINAWKADKWDPKMQMDLYKRAGAKFFVSMANHHDNMDMYNSKYQPWNSVNVGPKKDIVGIWADLSRKAGLLYGVSVHTARAWSWMEDSQGSDKDGPLKGVPYDGKLTKADGKGTWWDGMDPQDLYEQNHKPGEKPDEAYKLKFFNRTKDLIDTYKPDLLYFDDSRLPLGDAGLSIAAHFFNANKAWHKGKLEGVITSKDLSPLQQKAVVNDLERNMTTDLLKTVWQKDLCIGTWHYSNDTYLTDKYRKPKAIINLLVDVVSKNGTFLLNFPMPGNGQLDDKEIFFLKELEGWMNVNGESIYGTRPWVIYGEGPSVKNDATAKDSTVAPRGMGPAMTAKDIRFNKKGNVLYATALGWPDDNKITIKTLATNSTHFKDKIAKVELLGSKQKLQYTQNESGLLVTIPGQKVNDYGVVLKITQK
ncbi:MAG: alpha-L-fucosidase [Pyrinomonadaceae bacterium]|nr:alpha-L-fucosidase [Sphingobacteriaceae bacterium]